MDRQEQERIYRNRRSSKEELREALGAALGLPQMPGKGKENPGVFNVCKTAFCSEYAKTAGVSYTFAAKDGVALSKIIAKLEGLGEQDVASAFSVLMQKLPEWYKKNAFALPVIEKKFNEIIASISRNGGQISNSYKQKLLSDLRS